MSDEQWAKVVAYLYYVAPQYDTTEEQMDEWMAKGRSVVEGMMGVEKWWWLAQAEEDPIFSPTWEWPHEETHPV
jgi:hypothetical protein